LAGTIEIFEGVDKPETEEPVLPPQALIKLREIIIKNFFIDLSDFVIMNKVTIKNSWDLLQHYCKFIFIMKFNQEIL